MTQSLRVQLEVDPELVREGGEALVAAVVFRKWGGPAAQIEAASAVITQSELTLEVGVPDAIVHTSLPPQLGGPFAFALGYFVVREQGEGDTAAKVVAPAARVVWLSGAFPTESFGKALEQMPGMSDFEKKTALEQLGALPTGLSLAHADGGTRSLVGFTLAEPDSVVRLNPRRSIAWPPEIF